MEHSDPALPRHCDGHARLGDGVHGTRNEGHADGDVAGHPGGGVDLTRDNVGFSGQQQHVVIGEPEIPELRGPVPRRSVGAPVDEGFILPADGQLGLRCLGLLKA